MGSPGGPLQVTVARKLEPNSRAKSYKSDACVCACLDLEITLLSSLTRSSRPHSWSSACADAPAQFTCWLGRSHGAQQLFAHTRGALLAHFGSCNHGARSTHCSSRCCFRGSSLGPAFGAAAPQETQKTDTRAGKKCRRRTLCGASAEDDRSVRGQKVSFGRPGIPRRSN